MSGLKLLILIQSFFNIKSCSSIVIVTVEARGFVCLLSLQRSTAVSPRG